MRLWPWHVGPAGICLALDLRTSSPWQTRMDGLRQGISTTGSLRSLFALEQPATRITGCYDSRSRAILHLVQGVWPHPCTMCLGLRISTHLCRLDPQQPGTKMLGAAQQHLTCASFGIREHAPTRVGARTGMSVLPARIVPRHRKVFYTNHARVEARQSLLQDRDPRPVSDLDGDVSPPPTPHPLIWFHIHLIAAIHNI